MKHSPLNTIAKAAGWLLSAASAAILADGIIPSLRLVFQLGMEANPCIYIIVFLSAFIYLSMYAAIAAIDLAFRKIPWLNRSIRVPQKCKSPAAIAVLLLSSTSALAIIMHPAASRIDLPVNLDIIGICILLLKGILSITKKMKALDEDNPHDIDIRGADCLGWILTMLLVAGVISVLSSSALEADDAAWSILISMLIIYAAIALQLWLLSRKIRL